MSDAQARPTIDDLLEDRGWVQRLAAGIVRDPDDADDVAQSAWVRALGGGPRERGAAKGWFRSVVRNLALQRRRSEGRRKEREAQAARPREEASTDELVGRVELQAQLAQAVAALREPYRETVVLRYFEELPVREVARRQDVPARTVETRLRRGLQLLREDLDRRHGGDRRAWFGTLAGLVAVGGTPAVKILVAIGAFLLLLPIVWIVMPDRDSPLSLDGAPGPFAPPPTAERFGMSIFSNGRFDPGAVGASWYFDWYAERRFDSELEFVPMVGHSPDGLDAGELAEIARAAEAGHPPGTIWLIGGLIGYQEDTRSPEAYARDFHACREALLAVDPTYRFATGPLHLTTDHRIEWQYLGGSALGYLDAVLTAHRELYGAELGADFFAGNACVIAGEGVDFEAFRSHVVRFRRFLADRGLRDRGVILTDVGVPVGDPGYPAIGEFLARTMDFLATARDPGIGCTSDDDRLVQRWCWATAQSPGVWWRTLFFQRGALHLDISQTALFNRDGRVNFLGRAYADAVRRAVDSGWVEPRE